MPKTYNKELLQKLYHQMLLMRRFEEKAGQLYGMGLIGGFCHLYIGQEAVAAGVAACLNDPNSSQPDAVITSYRDHGIMLACKSSPNKIMAELLGRVDGCSLGIGGSMHMFDAKRGFYGGHGIVGAQVPIGTGLAFAFKYKKQKNICVTYFGDGAVNQGQVYEAFNMAKLWNLPVLYIIENNEYGMGTSVERSCGNTELYKRGESFGIPGLQINGMDVLEVYDTVLPIIDSIRHGNGPMLIEMKTYRYRGHSMSDPGNYRSKEEVMNYREHKDPIHNLSSYMLSNKFTTQEWLDEQEMIVKQIVKEAEEFAKASPEPGEEYLYKNIYKENL